MELKTIIYLLLIIIVNVGVFGGLHRLRKSYGDGFKGQMLGVASNLLKLVSSFVSISIIALIFELHLMDYLAIELWSFKKDVSITGFLIVFLVFTISLLVIINRFLSKVFTETRGRGLHSIPVKVTKSLRTWVSFLAFLALIEGVTKITGSSVHIFDIVLLTVAKVQITIGKIVQAIFMGYTVHIVILTIEFFYNQHISSKKIDTGKGRTVFQIVKYFVWVVTIVAIIGSLGISVNVLLAGSAALFVGLGFGVQALFNDFVSGLIILFEGTIRVNDVVELENGIIGKVEEIGLRASKVLTRDNIITIVPNNNFVGKNVINWTYNESKTRFKVNVGVAYGSDVRLVEKILIDAAINNEYVFKTPKPFVYFNDFGESSLDFSLFFWTDESYYVEKVKSELRFAIDDGFRKHNIEIPFPQRDLHIRSGYKS
ncbi:mechanosensitive ion channel family protein [Labilibacter marinus]|uniref:mechanosensitive ion channel family protein n=1 Tax=Labilibacter marinus TaxID=1477105 RepID=UPI0009FA2171|nr:mechanosensitive ion channel domain-containing protein [Labilibacter marinus]